MSLSLSKPNFAKYFTLETKYSIAMCGKKVAAQAV